MPPESAPGSPYFDTPARAERLQLVQHLVRNAGDAIYLRAPAGAGKTRFAKRLIDQVDDDAVVVWLHGSQQRDVRAAVFDQLGLGREAVLLWPDTVLEAIGERHLLAVADDADELAPEAVSSLFELHARGVQLLFVGRGALATRAADQQSRMVDLPAFDRAQTVEFLRSRAGAQAARITEDLAAALHRAANGLPGPLLAALAEVLSQADADGKPKPKPAAVIARPGRRTPLWQWLAGAALGGLLAAAIVFQDRINALFEPPAPAPEVAVAPIAWPQPAPARIDRPAAAEALPGDAPLQAETAVIPEVSLPEIGGSRPPKDPSPQGAGLESPAEESELPAVTKALPAAEMPDALGPAPSPSLATPGPPGDARPVRASGEDGGRSADAPATDSASAPPPDGSASGSAGGSPGKSVATGPDEHPPAPDRATAVAPAQPAMPAADGAAPRQRAAAEAAAAPAGTQAPLKTTAPSTPNRGQAWLDAREAGHYTLQLAGARDRAALQRFVRQHALPPPYAIFERPLQGRPWYSLVSGDYPDRAAALAARARLPAAIASAEAWPRTFASIRESQRQP